MKRKIFFVTIMSVMVLSFTACGKSTGELDKSQTGSDVSSEISSDAGNGTTAENSGDSAGDSAVSGTNSGNTDSNSTNSGDTDSNSINSGNTDSNSTNSGNTDSATTNTPSGSTTGDATSNSTNTTSIVGALVGDASSATDENGDPLGNIYVALRDAYKNQEMLPYADSPYVPRVGNYEVSEKYDTVTYKNLQGSWKNTYTDTDGSYVEEILTVNGERGRIQTYIDGKIQGAWNDKGAFSIEDRSADGKCPAIRINSDMDNSNLCTIYVRWVHEDAFYDGGFLTEWKRMESEPVMENNWLFDTVNLENLQGVWYSEYYDAAGTYQDVIVIDGKKASILEAIDGRISNTWNGEGSTQITYVNLDGYSSSPMLNIEMGSNGTAGIYITYVDTQQEMFYDRGLNRYWVKIPTDMQTWYPDGSDEEEDYYVIADSAEGSAIGHGIYTINIWPIIRSEDELVTKWGIEVSTQTDGLIASMIGEIDEDSTYFPELSDYIFFKDVDGDGTEDIMLRKGCFGTRSVGYFYCYLYRDGEMHLCEGFDEIPDVYVDEENGEISGSLMDGPASYESYFYEIQGDKAVLIRTEVYKYNDKTENFEKVG